MITEITYEKKDLTHENLAAIMFVHKENVELILSEIKQKYPEDAEVKTFSENFPNNTTNVVYFINDEFALSVWLNDYGDRLTYTFEGSFDSNLIDNC